MLDEKLVKEKKEKLKSMLKVGNIIPCRIYGKHARHEILKVNHSTKNRKVITSIVVIYRFTPNHKPIKHKMDSTEIRFNVFVDGHPFHWWYEKYIFYPKCMEPRHHFDDVDEFKEGGFVYARFKESESKKAR